MARARHIMLHLLVAVLVTVAAGCAKKATPPPMHALPNPQPGPGADALEVERYQLETEKRTLESSYGSNLDRIQQINARLIEINLELRRRTSQF